MIKLTDGCCRGSMQYKANINKVKAERPEDFIFYCDPMGEWKFSELLGIADDYKLDKESVKEYIFDNLESLCTYDVPSMYQIIKKHFVGDKFEEELLKEMEQEYMESHKGKEQEEGQAENSDFKENDLPFEEEPEEEGRMVDTNIGRMPIEDYREIIAMHYGFDSYADLRSQGGCIGHGMDEEEPEL